MNEVGVKVRIGGTGWINRADGTKTPIVISGETTEEQAKAVGIKPEEKEQDNGSDPQHSSR